MQSIFAVDIILKFFTDYRDKSEVLVTSHKKIAIRYFQFWFFIDLICVIPFQIYSFEVENFIRILRLLKFSRVLNLLVKFLNGIFKLIKITKTVKDLNKIKFFLNCITKLWQSLIIMIFTIYGTACVFYWYLKKFDNNFEQRYIEGYSQDRKLLYLLYFITTTLASIGFGDFFPTNRYEKGFIMLVIIFGIASYSYIMGIFNSSISEYNEIMSEPDNLFNLQI